MAGRSNPLNNAISMQKTQTIGNTLAELDMILFETTEKKNIQGANPDEKKLNELNYKKTVEKNVWLTVPTSKLYIRNPDSLISPFELKAISDKDKETL